MNISALYARYAELLALEEQADVAFEKLDIEWAQRRKAGMTDDDAIPAGYAEARERRDSLFDERTDLQERLLHLPQLDSLDQINVNLEIAAHEADIFDGAGDYIRLVAAQVRAFLA